MLTVDNLELSSLQCWIFLVLGEMCKGRKDIYVHGKKKMIHVVKVTILKQTDLLAQHMKQLAGLCPKVKKSALLNTSKTQQYSCQKC